MTTSGNKNDFYLKCPGAQLTQAEREYIRLAAIQVSEKFPAPTFVNLGVMWGASMHCLRAGSKDAFMYGVDIDFDTNPLQGSDELGIGWDNGNKSVLTMADSAEYGDVWHSKPVHIVFVDADHSYEAVKADIKAWSPHVVSGGFMIFHDYAPTKQNLDQFPEIAGVRKAVDEWYGIEGVRDYQAINISGLPDPPDSLFVARKL